MYCLEVINKMNKKTEEKKAMEKNEILENIRMLAASQGFYERLYQSIMESDEKEDILQYLENQNFTTTIDLILFLEG